MNRLFGPVSLVLALPAFGCPASSPSDDDPSTSSGSSGDTSSTTGSESSGDSVSSSSATPTTSESSEEDTVDPDTTAEDTNDDDGTTGGCPTEPCAEYCEDDGFILDETPIAHARNLAFIDADGDGAQELLFAKAEEGGLWLLPAAAAGPEEAILPTGMWIYPATGDLDGDGDEDIAASVDADILLLLNDGTGAFATAGTIEGISGRLSVADLDGEGELDIFVEGSEDERRILFAQSDLEYLVSEPFVREQPQWASVGLAIGQFDGIGGEDIAFPDGDIVSWWFDDDTPGGTADASRPDAGTMIVGGDFDGDGLYDAVNVDETGASGLEIRGWRGGELDAMEPWSVDPPNSGSEQWFTTALSGDFDGDGHDDLVLHYDGWMHIRRGAPGGFGCIASYDVGGGYLDGPISGDFDGDGRDELVWSSLRWMKLVPR